MKQLIQLCAFIAMTIFAATSAHAQDVAAGEKVFKKCKACHVADEEKNKVGPYLLGVVGRDIASIEGYKYSKAMVAFSEGDKTWDEAALTEFLAAPRKVVKGTKMGFPGLKKDADIVNVIAFLKAQTEE